jgi:hypothetical protein
MLSTYCDLTPDKATEKAQEVIEQYNEDVKAIRNAIVINVNEPIMTTEQTQQNTERLVDYGFGKYRVYLPENEDEARAIWSKIKKMVDPIFGEKV